MAKHQSKFTKDELELLGLIMKRLHLTQRELTEMKKKVQRMLNEGSALRKKRN